MKKNARKALAAVLAACMLLTLLPTAAFALDEPAHSHKVCVNTVSHGEGTCAHTDVAYTAWTETDRLPDSGNYYLAVDVTLGATSGAALGGDTKKAHITGELNLCLNGHSINYTTDDWNNSSYPDNANGPINVDENGTLNLCDCQNTAYRFQETDSNRIWYWTPAADGEEAKYTVNSGYITGKPYGGLVHVNGGTFHFWSGALINNKNGSKARGINLEKGTANLYGGQISGHNDAGVSAGERNISGARTLNCYGTCISDNYIRGVEACGTAESHATIHMTAPTKIEGNRLGGVRLYEYADFTMAGGEITGSEGENGALYCNGDNTVTLSGGKITGNIHAFDSSWGHDSSSGAGGIGIKGDDVLTISGDVLLSGNTDTGDDSKPCDLHIYNEDPTDYHPIQIAGALTKPAQPAAIYAYKPNDLKTTAFTSGWATYMASANIADYFVSYDPAYTIGKNTDGELVFTPAHTHAVSVGCETDSGDQVTFKPLTMDGDGKLCVDGAALTPDTYGTYTLGGGSYYLAGDITLNNTIQIIDANSAPVNLCLNGHTLDLGAGRVNIRDTSSGKGVLNLCDCGTEGKVTSAHSGAYTNAATVEVGYQFSLYGGTVENTAASGSNKNAVGFNGGSLSLYGGKLVSQNGNGLWVNCWQTDSLTLSGNVAIQGGADKAGVYFSLPNSTWEENIRFALAGPLTKPQTPWRVAVEGGKPMPLADGWSTYMGEADFDDYFRSAAQGVFVGQRENGDLELARYAITQQPSAENNYTVVANGAPASAPAYQWYPATVTTVDITTANAAIYGEEDEGGCYQSSAFEGGKWTASQGYDIHTPGYFTMPLKRGDKVAVTLATAELPARGQLGLVRDFDEPGEYVQVWYPFDGDTEGYSYVGTAATDGDNTVITYVIPADGTYVLQLDGLHDTSAAPAVSATLTHAVLGAALTGQTNPKLNTTGLAGGTYLCQVSWADGTVMNSDVVAYTPPAPPHTHDGVTFTAWTSADSLPDAEGNYYLTTDVTLADTWQTPEDVAVNLCLNGHSVTGPGGKAAVHSVSELTLLNCQERQAVIDGGTGGTAVEARLGSLAFSGSGLIKLAATGRYSCALDIGIQRLGGPTLVATIPNTVTLEVTEGASSALYVHESTNNKVRVSGAKVFGNSSTGVQVDCGSVEITDGTITGMPALYTHWQGTITVSGGRVSTDTGGHAIEVMGPVSVTGAPTVFGPAVIIYSSFDQGKLDAQGYTGSQKISLMIQDTVPAKAAVGDIIVTNGTLSQFQLVSSKFSLAADGTDLKLGDPSAQPAHTHSWAAAWSKNDTHHWHECTADGCGITDYSTCNEAGAAYAAHVYDDDADATCNTCGYTRTITPPEPDGADVSGTVTDDDAPVVDATVKLVKGREVIRETTTGANGAYTFTNVDPGDYNVVAAKDGKTMTILVKVETADLTEQNLAMPADSVNSVLDVKENTPAVVVGGLEAEAASHTEAGKTVTVTMTVESKAETDESAAADIAKIKEAASGKTLTFLAVTVEKQVGEEAAQPVPETSQLLTIIIPFDKTGKKDITVYRFHGDAAEALPTAANSDGEYFVVGSGAVTVYAKKFSTYAIGYATETITPSRPSRPSTKPAEPEPVWPFVDVTEADWCYGGVKYVYESKLMEGTDESHFSPALDTSRAMAATILWRLEGSPAMGGGKGGTFPDVPDGQWYTDAVEWAAAHGVVKGYGDGRFGPEDVITREQLAALLYRFAQAKGKGDIQNGTEVLRFADAGDVSDWAKEAMTWAVDKGLVTGKGGDILDPAANVTRAEAAVMLGRFAALLK